MRLAVVGVKNTQGINVPAVRMIAALGARNVVVYGGDESVVYGSTSSCPPYTTHRSHTILPEARRVLRRRMREACRHAVSSTNPARVSTTERPFVMSTARGHPMRGTPDRRAARPGGHSFSWAAISESAGLWDADGRRPCNMRTVERAVFRSARRGGVLLVQAATASSGPTAWRARG